jgi:hypothetical protein
VGTTVGFQATTMEALTPWSHLLNLTTVPTVTYEYPFCLLSSEQPWPLARRKSRGLLRAVGYGSINLDTTLFPPAAISWGTMYLIPNMVSSLLAEGEEPPTYKNYTPAQTAPVLLSHLNGHGRAGFHHLSAQSNSSL